MTILRTLRAPSWHDTGAECHSDWRRCRRRKGDVRHGPTLMVTQSVEFQRVIPLGLRIDRGVLERDVGARMLGTFRRALNDLRLWSQGEQQWPTV